MIVITDILREPFDEGAKIATLNLLNELKQKYDSIVISINCNETPDFVNHSFISNKLLFDIKLYKKIREYNGKVLYIPEASITTVSFIRARLIQVFTKKRVIMVSMQQRPYGYFSKLMIKHILCVCVITQSENSALYLNGIGIKSRILPLGVDDTKFNPMEVKAKVILRDRYSIPSDSIVILHVGHIRTGRNLNWLLEIKSRLTEIEVIVAGSTSTPQDKNLHKLLKQNGIKVIRDYLENINELYNVADYYLFPVLRSDAAIETPLSVLEAMACNIPIITTAFGSLPDLFKQDECFHFVNSIEEVVEILESPRVVECRNRDKIKAFTWKEVTKQLLEIIG